MLLMGGLSTPPIGWALQAAALASHFQVVTLENRGVGQTDLPPERDRSVLRFLKSVRSK